MFSFPDPGTHHSLLGYSTTVISTRFVIRYLSKELSHQDGIHNLLNVNNIDIPIAVNVSLRRDVRI